MSSEIDIVPLGSIVSVKGGKRLPKEESLQSIPNEHPYIRVRDMGHRFIPAEGLEYVPDEVFPKIQRYIVEENDLIISIVGTIGLVSIIDSRFHLASQTENAAKLTGLDTVDSQYLYYFLSSHIGQTEIHKGTVGAVQPKLPLYNIEKISVLWPDKNARREIANLLGSLDNKIQLNHQINQTLEQMAQALFKSWFVRFEPVKAKITALEAGGSEEDALLAAMQAISGTSLFDADALAAGGEEQLTGLQAEQPEQYAELRATAELFPSAMQDSELGEIPEGWDFVQLKHFITLEYGKALKKTTRVAGPYPVYGSGGVTGSHNKSMVPGPGIIVGRKGTVGSIYWETNDFYPIDTTYYVLTKNGCSLSFSYYLLQTLGLKSMNTDAAVPGLNRNNVYRLAVPSYSLPIIARFTHIVDSISRKISAANAGSQSLTELRDTLLPKLLSGELSVSGTKTQLAETSEAANV